MPTIQGVTYTEAWAEAVAIAPINAAILLALEFNHSAFTEPARIVSDRADLVARLEADAPYNPSQYVTFTALPVDISLPEESTEAPKSSLTILVDNVSGILVPYLDLAIGTLEPVKVILREYVSTDLTTPARTPPIRMVVRAVQVTETRVAIEASYGDPSNRAFPGKNYITSEYPGLAL